MQRNYWNRYYKAQPFSGVIPGKVVLEFSDPVMPAPFDTYFRAAQDQVRRDLESSMADPLPPVSTEAQVVVRFGISNLVHGGFGAFSFRVDAEIIDPADRNVLIRLDAQHKPSFDGYAETGLLIRELKGKLLDAFNGPEVASLLSRDPVEIAGGRNSQRPPTTTVASAKDNQGIFALEHSIPFNVLDRVAYDPETSRITLMGHFDPAFPGPRIPYLQHLAELLENPSPEFSLEWTKESERKIDELVGRLESEREMARLASVPGDWFDSDGTVNTRGAMMLRIFGVYPTPDGRPAGSLGIKTTLDTNGEPRPRIISVAPGSAGSSAGLAPGDLILAVANDAPWHPRELTRALRRAGAGSTVKIQYIRDRQVRTTQASLDRVEGNPWKELSRYDTMAAILEASGSKDASQIILALQKVYYMEGTQFGAKVLIYLAVTCGRADDYINAINAYHAGKISEREALRRAFRVLLEGMETKIDFPRGALTTPFDNQVRAGKSPADAIGAMFGSSFENAFRPVFAQNLRQLLHRQDEIVMDLGQIEEVSGSIPVVEPHFIGVSPRSQLARVLFQADYLCKSILVDPEIAGRVPGLQTEYRFYRDATPDQGEFRMWIDVAAFDLARSPDGHVMETKGVTMRFNTAPFGRGNNGNEKDVYGKHLSSHYRSLAQVYPAFHELSEVAKLIPVAKWLRYQDGNLKLPTTGRTLWTPPRQVQGQVLLIWSPNGTKVTMNAPGGIKLDVPPVPPGVPLLPGPDYPVPVEASVVDLRDLAQEQVTVVPLTDISPVVRVRPTIKEPPSPLRPPAGWVARAKKGRGVLDTLSVKLGPDNVECSADLTPALKFELDRITMMARQLDRTERAVNAISGQNPKHLLIRENMVKELNQAEKDFVQNSLDIATQGILDAYDGLAPRLRNATGLKQLGEEADALVDAHDAMEAYQDRVKKLRIAWETWSTDDPAAMQRSIKDSLEVLAEIAGETPMGGNGTLGRAWVRFGKTVNRLEAAKKWAEYGKSLYTLTKAQILTNKLDPKVEGEALALRDTLLPLMEEQSRALDIALSSPDVKRVLQGNGTSDCIN